MEEKKLTEKSLEKLLKAPEVAALHQFLREPGWEAIKKLSQALRDDWAEQITRIDYRLIQDETIIKDMIFKQGMLHGIDLFVGYLQKKHEKWEEEAKENEH